MIVLLLQFSSNTVGRQAALFEHSLVVWLRSALESVLGVDCLDLYPEARDGEALTLTRSLSPDEARECAEGVEADYCIWGDLHFLPEGGKSLEEVNVEVRFSASEMGSP